MRERPSSFLDGTFVGEAYLSGMDLRRSFEAGRVMLESDVGSFNDLLLRVSLWVCWGLAD